MKPEVKRSAGERHVTIKAGDLISRTTMIVRIEGMDKVRWRLAVGKWLIGLAARVIGCGIRIDNGEAGR